MKYLNDTFLSKYIREKTFDCSHFLMTSSFLVYVLFGLSISNKITTRHTTVDARGRKIYRYILIKEYIIVSREISKQSVQNLIIRRRPLA